MRAEAFRALGGYRELRLLEDVDFSRRLKRHGTSVLVRVPLRTSGRRFLTRGPWRTFFFCWWLVGRFTLGLDTERYAERWRDDTRRGASPPFRRSAGFARSAASPQDGLRRRSRRSDET